MVHWTAGDRGPGAQKSASRWVIRRVGEGKSRKPMEGTNLPNPSILRGVGVFVVAWVCRDRSSISSWWIAQKHARTKEAADVATAPRSERNAAKPAQVAKWVDEGRESLDL